MRIVVTREDDFDYTIKFKAFTLDTEHSPPVDLLS